MQYKISSKEVSMLWFIYYLSVLTVSFLFGKYIHITSLSAIPIVLAILSGFMAIYNYNNRQNDSLNYNPGTVELTDKEYAKLAYYSSFAHTFCIPLYLPFILFFGNAVKFLSIALFLLAFTLGPVIFRIKQKDRLHARLKAEENELLSQKKKEESGRFN